EVYSGSTHVPVYQFARWDDSQAYAKLCRVHHKQLGVPRRFLVLATTDADTFFVDLKHPHLRVMYFEYVEGDYQSHFGDEEMDCAAESLEEFMTSFFDASKDPHF